MAQTHLRLFRGFFEQIVVENFKDGHDLLEPRRRALQSTEPQVIFKQK